MIGEDKQKANTAFKQRRWPGMVSLCFALIAFGGVLALAYISGIVICPLKRLTGLPCPTCGSTRAVVCALRGDFTGAFAFQPLVMTVIVAAGPVALLAWLSPRMKRLLAVVVRHPLTWVVGGLAVVANWVYVIMHGN